MQTPTAKPPIKATHAAIKETKLPPSTFLPSFQTLATFLPQHLPMAELHNNDLYHMTHTLPNNPP
jgi:hypothetical protein